MRSYQHLRSCRDLSWHCWGMWRKSIVAAAREGEEVNAVAVVLVDGWWMGSCRIVVSVLFFERYHTASGIGRWV